MLFYTIAKSCIRLKLFETIIVILLLLLRPRRRWEDNIRMDLEQISINA